MPDFVDSIAYDGLGGRVELRGQSTSIVTLDTMAPVQVRWEPTDRRAMDVEVRVVFQQVRGYVQGQAYPFFIYAPWIRWSTHIGHGKSVHAEPAQSFPTTSDSLAFLFGEGAQLNTIAPRVVSHLMPARGLLFRVNARELTVTLQNTGYFGQGAKHQEEYGATFPADPGNTPAPTLPAVTMIASFQPVMGLDIVACPRFTAFDPHNPSTGTFVQLPPSAREWRVFDSRGMPFDPAEVDETTGETEDDYRSLTLLDPFGIPLYPELLLSDLAEFRPIPPGAWGFYVEPHTNDADAYTLDGAVAFNVEYR